MSVTTAPSLILCLGNSTEELWENLRQVLSEESGSEFLMNVLDSSCFYGEFYHPVLFLLLSVGIQIDNKDSFMKTVNFLIKMTKSSKILEFIDKIEPVGEESEMTRLLLEENINRKNQLSCRFLVLLWKDVVTNLPRIAGVINCDDFLLQSQSNQPSSNSLIKETFEILLGLTTHGSVPIEALIQETFDAFMTMLSTCKTDVISFLSTFWLQFLSCEWKNVNVSSKLFLQSFRVAFNLIKSGSRTSSVVRIFNLVLVQ